MKAKGYLFGRYDSRGGTMFVEAATKRLAVRRARELGMDAPEDFLCAATIESADPIRVGTDLDGSMTGCFDPDTGEGVTAWVVGRTGDPDFWLDYLPTDGSALRIWYGKKPSGASFAPRWDDDAFGLLFETATETRT